jgi:conserved hypothetical protein (putative transposase or invertase)
MKNITGSKYLNLLTDYAFKRIFASETNKDLLIDFLNELIIREDKIIDLTYRPTEQLGAEEQDRKAVFDIYCKTDKGEYCIVELQKVRQAYFKDRSIYYSTFVIQEQAVKGDWNYELHPVYTVAILDFTLFNETEEDKNRYREEVKLMRTSTKTVFYDKLSFVYVELPKFVKNVDELETNFDRWMYLLKSLPTLQDRPKEIQGKTFDKLFKMAEINKLTPQEMKDYNKSILEYSDVRDAANYAREEGFKDGIEEGVEKGRKERDIEIAKILLSENKSIDTIIKYTAKTVEDMKFIY